MSSMKGAEAYYMHELKQEEEKHMHLSVNSSKENIATKTKTWKMTDRSLTLTQREDHAPQSKRGEAEGFIRELVGNS